ncbi:GTPase-activating protein GYP7-like [Asparagus officinalis]|uniref:GTPase-activating protein GYP7-like n=1 Tax=Asparagus officinalis TaxID=4686 RepID=UPI00098DFC83|nr:GTPase-activating protein GYP7-like [Asparagus officinalis]
MAMNAAHLDAVEFPTGSLSPHATIGCSGEVFSSVSVRQAVGSLPQFDRDRSDESCSLIRDGGRHCLRRLITDAPFTTDSTSTQVLEKPSFLFGDHNEDPAKLILTDEHWLNNDEGALLFKCTSDSIGVRAQLTILSTIIKSLDPKLHEHIQNLDGGEYLFAFRMLMVLFRREFSFVDTLYLWELMWAMEYSPMLFSLYESGTKSSSGVDAASNVALLKKYGKFVRKNVRIGQKNAPQAPLSIFVVASVLETQSKKLLQEAKGQDDVVQILNDITGNLDAKKACDDALKLHSKYLTKVKVD